MTKINLSGLKAIRNIKEIRDLVSVFKKQNKKIGFVPTMGYLHEGHLSLIRKAREECDVVVISIFINPTQFGPREDYKRYPRDLKRDSFLAESEGVDIIFYPSVKTMYPKNYSTYVTVKGLSQVLCGRSRPGHFQGVTTICTKLFNIVQPDIAYFGQKDAQQAIIIKRMVRDLNIPLKIKVLPIIREKDGLAMSSRNVYLSKEERKQATILYKSLVRAKEMVENGHRDVDEIKKKVRRMISSVSKARIDYVEIVEMEGLKSVKKITQPVLLVLAVWLGKARLIDNIILKP